MHTAVKIDPQYPGPVIYVKDASRAVGVAQNLVSADSKADYVARTKADYAQKREQHAKRRSREPLAAARSGLRQSAKTAWANYVPPCPTFLGVRAFDDYPLAELVERIDWTPFFQAWELRGRYPGILDDPEQGGQPASCSRGTSHAGQDHHRTLADSAGGDRLFPGPSQRRR
jgi:5-methyltetrahydrofolate--homocysteine methyltransferase